MAQKRDCGPKRVKAFITKNKHVKLQKDARPRHFLRDTLPTDKLLYASDCSSQPELAALSFSGSNNLKLEYDHIWELGKGERGRIDHHRTNARVASSPWDRESPAESHHRGPVDPKLLHALARVKTASRRYNSNVVSRQVTVRTVFC